MLFFTTIESLQRRAVLGIWVLCYPCLDRDSLRVARASRGVRFTPYAWTVLAPRVKYLPGMKDLKIRFLAAIGYVCSADESPNEAFARLRVENPDAFPVPRCNESILDAIGEVVTRHEGGC